MVLKHPPECHQLAVAVVYDLAGNRLFIKENPARSAERLHIAFMVGDFLNDGSGQAAFTTHIRQWTFHHDFLSATLSGYLTSDWGSDSFRDDVVYRRFRRLTPPGLPRSLRDRGKNSFLFTRTESALALSGKMAMP
jgi:hypothetical protein